MKFIRVYKCQRCGILFTNLVYTTLNEEELLDDYNSAHNTKDNNRIHKCDIEKYGISELIGYDKIDDVV